MMPSARDFSTISPFLPFQPYSHLVLPSQVSFIPCSILSPLTLLPSPLFSLLHAAPVTARPIVKCRETAKTRHCCRRPRGQQTKGLSPKTLLPKQDAAAKVLGQRVTKQTLPQMMPPQITTQMPTRQKSCHERHRCQDKTLLQKHGDNRATPRPPETDVLAAEGGRH